ncbi:MAG TPA: DNA-processing protein DprA [Candidatus Limnocylindria bacterium]
MIGVSAAGPLGADADGFLPDERAPLRLRPSSEPARERVSDLLDPEEERQYWIAISLIPGIGPVSFTRILERFGSARAAWVAGTAMLSGLARLPAEAPEALHRLRRRGAAATAARVERRTRAAGGRVVTAIDADYPPALRDAVPAPAVLYLAGDADAFALPGVAVVGTRRASGYGRSCASEIADELARAGAAVVSGLALGIDGEAHQAALAAGGRTIAVLPSPIDRVYPPRHRTLAQRIVASGGALVSELPPGLVPGRPDFARRNRIIAGLASAVVVVEAPDRSGALLTAAAAVQLGRELYAVPGPIDALASRGCNRLIADQLATIVTSSVGLLGSIGLGRVERPLSVANLSDNEALVLATLLKRVGSVEELMTRTQLATSSLASALTLLEARGLVTSYGGATFHPTLVARRLGWTP